MVIKPAMPIVMKQRTYIVYGTLTAIWLLLVGWQMAEHARVEASARAVLRNRAKEISKTLFLVMHSQSRFGVIDNARLDRALSELVSSGGELRSVFMLNAQNEPLASAGDTNLPPLDELKSGELWTPNLVTFINPGDLGTNLSIVIPSLTNRPPPWRTNDMEHPHDDHPDFAGGPPLRPPGPDMPDMGPPPKMDMGPDGSTNRFADDGEPRPGRRQGGGRRPPWLPNTNDPNYATFMAQKGVHGLLMTMSTQSLQPTLREDRLVRLVVGFLGAIAVLGTGLAWRSLAKTSELQIRLVRAREQNLHLQQMNLAAAGLAHETRNPLNIIRGLAQLISKEQSTPPEIRTRSREIIDETDRVTAQLNEFINYSRPREVRRTATNLCAVMGEVARALNFDIEEKKVHFQIPTETQMIEADEPMLRQALFNLALNAVQAIDNGGEIEFRIHKENASEIVIEVCDNGPGVSPENLDEIFKPYFTTHKKGTGLGLAVVHQIVAAHGWDIQCLRNQPTGAIFRISHIRIATKKN